MSGSTYRIHNLNSEAVERQEFRLGPTAEHKRFSLIICIIGGLNRKCQLSRGRHDSRKSASKKVGPNEPCPCGSGKKYKKCHRDKAKPQAAAPAEAASTMAYPRGIPGIPQYMVSVPRFKDPNDPRNAGGPDGLPGQYQVTLTLRAPAYL